MLHDLVVSGSLQVYYFAKCYKILFCCFLLARYTYENIEYVNKKIHKNVKGTVYIICNEILGYTK